MPIPKETQAIINYFKGKTGQEIDIKGVNRRGTEVYDYTTVHIDYPAYKAYDDMKVIQGEECPDAGYMSDYTITSDKGQYDRVVANFMDIRNVSEKYNRAVYTRMSAPTQSLPLERKTYEGTDDETYKTYWNHRVVSDNQDETITKSSWQAKGYDPAAEEPIQPMEEYLSKPDGYTPNDSAKPAQWQRSNQGIKSNQKILLAEKMPGVQSFLFPVKDISQTIYTSWIDVVYEYVENNGKIWMPRDSSGKDATFRIGDTLDENGWLISGVTVESQYGWYILKVQYKYADEGWRTELYDKADNMYDGDFD